MKTDEVHGTEGEPITTSDDLGSMLADAYQLAGAILMDLPKELQGDPRQTALLDLLDECARICEIEQRARDEEQQSSPSAPLLTLGEAAAESGLAASTLRVQLNAGRLKGEKRGRDWFVDSTSLLNYLKSRSSRGRPPASGARRLQH